MAETWTARSALGTEQGAAMREHGDPARVALRETPMPAMFDVRLQPADHGALAAAAAALGFELPLVPTKSSGGGGRSALWLGPDQWLIVAPADDAPPLAAALAHRAASVVDASDLRAVFELAGPHACDVLRKGCAIDLHARVFRPGDCAATALARVRVALHQPDARPAYRIYVERSYAPYLWDWLLDAAGEYI